MPECSLVREQMPLLLVEALEASAREEAHRHIEECSACGVEWRDIRATWMQLAALPELPVPERVRANFAAHVESLQPRRDNVVPMRRRPVVRWLAQAAAVTILVGGAYVAGNRQSLSFVAQPAAITDIRPATMPLAETVALQASQMNPEIQGRPNIANVRFIEGQNGGQVGVSFDMTSRITVTGSPDDKSLVNLIAYVLQDRTYPTTSRSSAIDWVKDTYALRSSADPEIVNALTSVLRNDTHEGVRIKAVETIGSLPPSLAADARNALVAALKDDPNPSVRIKAIEALALMAGAESGIDAATVDTLRQTAAQDDENPYVRVKAAEALGQISL